MNNWYFFVRNGIIFNSSKVINDLKYKLSNDEYNIIFQNKDKYDVYFKSRNRNKFIKLKISDSKKIDIICDYTFTIKDIIQIYDKNGNSVYEYNSNTAIIYKPSTFEKFKKQLDQNIDKINWTPNKPDIIGNYQIEIAYDFINKNNKLYKLIEKKLDFISLNEDTFYKYNSDLDDILIVRIKNDNKYYQFSNIEDDLFNNWNDYMDYIMTYHGLK